MARVRWTPEASETLEQILDFIALEDEAAARRTVTGVYQKATGLQQFPRTGRVLRQTPEGEIRIELYQHYRIAYHLGRDETIVILGMYHGAMDIERHLP